MSSGIVLGELARLLFPERYPYFTAYFEAERNELRTETCTDANRQAIRFNPDYALGNRSERQKAEEISTFVNKPYSPIWCMNKRG